MSESSTPIEMSLALSITALTPMCVGASGSSGGLADKALQRDAWNRPIIPGSQLKGRVRHACERIAVSLSIPICRAPVEANMCPHGPTAITRTPRESLHRLRARGSKTQCVICALFGSATYPSNLVFGDLAATPADAHFPPSRPYSVEERLRPGVGIDRRRQSALENILYLTETTEQGIVFEGAIRGRWLTTPLGEIEALAGLLIAGISMTNRWGGGTSRGLGWAEVELGGIQIGKPYTMTQLIEKVGTLCPNE